MVCAEEGAANFSDPCASAGRRLASIAYDAQSRRQSVSYANGATALFGYSARGDIRERASQCRTASSAVVMADWWGEDTIGSVLIAAEETGMQVRDVGVVLHEAATQGQSYGSSIFESPGLREAFEGIGAGLWVTGGALQSLSGIALSTNYKIVSAGLEAACQQYADDRDALEEFSPELVEELEDMGVIEEEGAGGTVPTVEERCTTEGDEEEIVVSCEMTVRVE